MQNWRLVYEGIAMARYGMLEPKDLRHAVDKLQDLIRNRAWIAFIGLCLTEYEGRSASKTTLGDRLVIIKPSGSLIVHGPRGFKPENWQPDTSTITISGTGDIIVLKAIRKSPRETLVLKCNHIYTIMWLEEPIKGEFWMYLNEHEIRDAIASNPSIIEEGLVITRVEKPVEPGFIDLYGVDKNGRLVVIELKRVKAGSEAVHQLLRYIESFRKRGVKVRPILVAPDFTESAIRLASVSGIELKTIDLRRLYEIITSKMRPRRSTLEEFL